LEEGTGEEAGVEEARKEETVGVGMKDEGTDVATKTPVD